MLTAMVKRQYLISENAQRVQHWYTGVYGIFILNLNINQIFLFKAPID